MNIHTRIWAVHLVRLVDIAVSVIILTMIVFGPWAFGCASSQTLRNFSILGVSQSWNVWVLCAGGLLPGLALIAGILLSRVSGQRPHVLDTADANSNRTMKSRLLSAPVSLLALLTALITGYAATALLNYQSAFNPSDFSFTYHSHFAWLPHSLDRASSIKSLVALSGLAAFFWGLLFWLDGNRHLQNPSLRKLNTPDANSFFLPNRLKLLLWVMTINGGLLAVESILQRLSATNQLLWLVTPHLNPSAEFQFGPYAYRANAAQYFNILWPVSLGFWWWLQNDPPRTGSRRFTLTPQLNHVVLVCVILMAACPIISGSRGGALISAGTLLAAASVLICSARKPHGAAKLGFFMLMLLILGLGLYFEGNSLAGRMRDFNTNLAQREQIYSAAKAMSREHPLFGTGPGTFEVLFQFYRNSPDDYWPSQLHNDWQETLITFGWLGSSLIWLSLFLVLVRWFLPGGNLAPWQFVAFLWMGLGSALIHARFDYPFQILSITALFLTVCAVLFSISRPGSG